MNGRAHPFRALLTTAALLFPAVLATGCRTVMPAFAPTMTRVAWRLPGGATLRPTPKLPRWPGNSRGSRRSSGSGIRHRYVSVRQLPFSPTIPPCSLLGPRVRSPRSSPEASPPRSSAPTTNGCASSGFRRRHRTYSVLRSHQSTAAGARSRVIRSGSTARAACGAYWTTSPSLP